MERTLKSLCCQLNENALPNNLNQVLSSRSPQLESSPFGIVGVWSFETNMQKLIDSNK